jgi:hypothetical protein
MRKPNSLTNIEAPAKIDDELAKRLSKAFEILDDIEEQ